MHVNCSWEENISRLNFSCVCSLKGLNVVCHESKDTHVKQPTNNTLSVCFVSLPCRRRAPAFGVCSVASRSPGSGPVGLCPRSFFVLLHPEPGRVGPLPVPSPGGRRSPRGGRSSSLWRRRRSWRRPGPQPDPRSPRSLCPWASWRGPDTGSGGTGGLSGFLGLRS